MCICELGRAKKQPPLQEAWKYLDVWLLEWSGSAHSSQIRSLASETEPAYPQGSVLGQGQGAFILMQPGEYHGDRM